MVIAPVRETVAKSTGKLAFLVVVISTSSLLAEIKSVLMQFKFEGFASYTTAIEYACLTSLVYYNFEKIALRYWNSKNTFTVTRRYDFLQHLQ